MGVRFTFIGTLDANTDVASNGYFVRKGKTSKGNDYSSVNLQIAQEKNNRAFVELFGMVEKKINTMNNDLNKIEVNWDDRFDADVVKEVANFKKFNIKNGDEKKEYISSYDAVKYIADNIDVLKNKRVVVTGQRKKNVYQGKITDRFKLGSIRVIGDDEDVVNKFTVNMLFMFNKDSIDISDWKSEHKIFINGWTKEYISDVKENRYVPQQIVFDCTKIDWDNEKHIDQVKFRLKMFGCELSDDNKISIKLKAKKLYSVGLITTFINGQEKLDFDESMLTDLQKEALELGLKTLDDFRPSGSIYGKRIVIYKLKDFDLRKDSNYEDGYVEEEITPDEFEEQLYVPVEEATEDEVVEDKDDDNESEDDDDLFD